MIGAETVDRLKRATPDRINEKIRREVAESVAERARLRDFDRRLAELDREWDIERTLITNAATISLVSLGLSFLDRRWLALTGIVGAFLLQHGLQGWCPPLPLFRAAGVRSRDEIDEERYALRAVRGDFDPLAQAVTPSDRTTLALDAVRGTSGLTRDAPPPPSRGLR